MKIVLIIKDWDFINLKRQTLNFDYKWNDFQFTEDLDSKYDYVVVLGFVTKDYNLSCAKENAILLTQEPPNSRYNWLPNSFSQFGTVLTQFESTDDHVINHQPCIPWFINKSYDQLKNEEPEFSSKKHLISCITSTKNTLPGHDLRLKFLYELKNNISFDLFGKGYQYIADKYDGLRDYKYSLAIENTSVKDYWTEKIADCYLSYSMPIYYGCTNISEYFPEDSFIQIDINNIPEAIEIINNAIENKMWEKNMESIIQARNLVLDNYQFFPSISKVINEMPEIRNSDNKILLSKNYFPENGNSFLTNLLKFIGYSL